MVTNVIQQFYCMVSMFSNPDHDTSQLSVKFLCVLCTHVEKKIWWNWEATPGCSERNFIQNVLCISIPYKWRSHPSKYLTISLKSWKIGAIPSKELLNQEVVYVSEIKDGMRSYYGFLFAPSISVGFSTVGRLTTTSDAAHWPGLGTPSCGTTFEVSPTTQNTTFPLIFYHSIGTDCDDTWRIVVRLS